MVVDEIGYIVSRATLDDLSSLAMLFDAYRIFYRQPSDLMRARRFLSERIKRDDSVIFLARDGGDMALGFVQLYPSFSSISTQQLWILNDLYVEARARRHGLARALMEAAHAHARCSGAIRVTLCTARENTSAQALYESIGYVREETMLEYALELVQAPARMDTRTNVHEVR